jgi:DnaK suppressor protein
MHELNLHLRKQEIQKMIAEHQKLLMEAGQELSTINSSDYSVDLYEKEKNQATIELLEMELEKVNQAIDMLNAGEYGKCESCGGQIEEERLKRMINTKLCSDCARAQKNLMH